MRGRREEGEREWTLGEDAGTLPLLIGMEHIRLLQPPAALGFLERDMNAAVFPGGFNFLELRFRVVPHFPFPCHATSTVPRPSKRTASISGIHSGRSFTYPHHKFHAAPWHFFLFAALLSLVLSTRGDGCLFRGLSAGQLDTHMTLNSDG